MTVDEAGATYPNIRFTERGLQRLAEVLTFVEDLHHQDLHDVQDKVRTELHERLTYLNGFGGTVSQDDARRRYQVTLGMDFAPLSFTVSWAALDRTCNEYRYSFNGGLIWHGGSNDPLAVSLDPGVLWGIHT